MGNPDYIGFKPEYDAKPGTQNAVIDEPGLARWPQYEEKLRAEVEALKSSVGSHPGDHWTKQNHRGGECNDGLTDELREIGFDRGGTTHQPSNGLTRMLKGACFKARLGSPESMAYSKQSATDWCNGLNLLIAIATVVAVVACVGLFKQTQRYRQTLAEEARLKTDLAAAQRRMLPARLPAETRSGPPAPERGVSDIHDDYFNFLLAHPDLAAIVRHENRLDALSRYSKAIDALGLPPDRREALLEILTDEMEGVPDVGAALLHNGIPINSPESQAAMESFVKSMDARIDDSLGPGSALQLKNAVAQSRLADLANGYIRDVANAGFPLEDSQKTALAALVEAMNDPVKNPQIGNPAATAYDPTDSLSSVERETLKRAEGFLNADQLAALKNSVATPARLQAIRWQMVSEGTTVVLP